MRLDSLNYQREEISQEIIERDPFIRRWAYLERANKTWRRNELRACNWFNSLLLQASSSSENEKRLRNDQSHNQRASSATFSINHAENQRNKNWKRKQSLLQRWRSLPNKKQTNISILTKWINRNDCTNCVDWKFQQLEISPSSFHTPFESFRPHRKSFSFAVFRQNYIRLVWSQSRVESIDKHNALCR